MGLNVAIIDYGLGNIGSISSSMTKIGVAFQVTSDHEAIRKAHAVIIPGVGSFDRGMHELKERKLVSLLRDLAFNGKPILGICLGMQLLFETSEESVLCCEGLSLIGGQVRQFRKDMISRIPHVGWNDVQFRKTFLDCSSDYYFVHSYYCDPTDEEVIIGITEYEQFRFVASVQKENVFGFQFHPEKSGQIGRKLLTHFITYVKEKNYPIPHRE